MERETWFIVEWCGWKQFIRKSVRVFQLMMVGLLFYFLQLVAVTLVIKVNEKVSVALIQIICEIIMCVLLNRFVLVRLVKTNKPERFYIFPWILLLFGNLLFFSFVCVLDTVSLLERDMYTLALSLLVAPITEELMFRRIILDEVLKIDDRADALLLSTALFCVVHWTFEVRQIIMLTVLGICLGMVWLKWRDVKICILFHAVYNLLGAVMIEL